MSWYILPMPILFHLLQKLLHLSISQWWAAIYPPPPHSCLPARQFCQDRRFSISIGTHEPRLTPFNVIPQALPAVSAFHSLHVAIVVFIPLTCNTSHVLLFSPQYNLSVTPLFLVVAPLLHLNLSYCFSNHNLDSQLANISLYLC